MDIIKIKGINFNFFMFISMILCYNVAMRALLWQAYTHQYRVKCLAARWYSSSDDIKDFVLLYRFEGQKATVNIQS